MTQRESGGIPKSLERESWTTCVANQIWVWGKVSRWNNKCLRKIIKLEQGWDPPLQFTTTINYSSLMTKETEDVKPNTTYSGKVGD